MRNLSWYLEPILITIGSVIMRFHERHNTRVWEWAERDPDATDDEMMRRIYWGVDPPECDTLYQDALAFGEAEYIRNDHTSRRIVRWYQVKYGIPFILGYHLRNLSLWTNKRPDGRK